MMMSSHAPVFHRQLSSPATHQRSATTTTPTHRLHSPSVSYSTSTHHASALSMQPSSSSSSASVAPHLSRPLSLSTTLSQSHTWNSGISSTGGGLSSPRHHRMPTDEDILPTSPTAAATAQRARAATTTAVTTSSTATAIAHAGSAHVRLAKLQVGVSTPTASSSKSSKWSPQRPAASIPNWSSVHLNANLNATPAASLAASAGTAATASSSASSAIKLIDFDSANLYSRTVIQIPVNRLMHFSSFLGLYGDVGRTPAGVVALFAAALWLYAQAVPPSTPEHFTSRPSGLMSLSGDYDDGSEASSSPNTPHSALTRASTQPTPGASPTSRGGIMSSAWSMEPISESGDGESQMPKSSSPAKSVSPSPSAVSTDPARDQRLGLLAAHNSNLAQVADAILIFLLDDALTSSRGNVRYLRATDRAMLDWYVRGRPELVTRFALSDTEAAERTRLQRIRRKNIRRQTAQARAAAADAKSPSKQPSRAADDDDDDDDDAHYQVSLLDDSSSDDDDDADDDDAEDGEKSDGVSSLPRSVSEGGAHLSPSNAGAVYSSATNVGVNDSLYFEIDENIYSNMMAADQSVSHTRTLSSSLTSPSSSAAESKGSIFSSHVAANPIVNQLTLYLSSDGFRRHFVPIRLLLDRQRLAGWRIAGYHAMLLHQNASTPVAQSRAVAGPAPPPVGAAVVMPTSSAAGPGSSASPGADNGIPGASRTRSRTENAAGANRADDATRPSIFALMSQGQFRASVAARTILH